MNKYCDWFGKESGNCSVFIPLTQNVQMEKRKGNSVAYNRFFNLYGPEIYSTVMRTTGSLEIMLKQLIALRP